ncbi:MAG: aspartate aminotransferase family protein, partial [Kiritimatiellia bacterium]
MNTDKTQPVPAEPYPRSSASICGSSYNARDKRNLWHPYTRFSVAGELPVIVRGEGPYLVDDNGTRYVDAISSWWACALGHGQPQVIEAIRRQAGELQHSILGNLTHPRAIELAERLARLVEGAVQLGQGETDLDEDYPETAEPTEAWRVLFASDGASAVEAALKIAIQYWFNQGREEKRRFAALHLGYHGDTLAAMSVGFVPEFHAPFASVVFPVLQAASPCCGTCAWGLTPESCCTECLYEMRLMFREHAHELAALIVEPLCMAAGGIRIYQPECLRRLAKLCADHQVLLIVDEVATGFGRTGRMFAFQHAGIRPDIICLGKALSAGYLPISATLARREIAETFSDQPEDHTLCHSHTFSGNPIAAAAALATLDVFRDEHVVTQAVAGGALLAAELSVLAGRAGVRNVRTLGMIAAVELEPARNASDEVARAARLRERMRADGVLVRPLGPVLYVMPPLTTPLALLRALAQ